MLNIKDISAPNSKPNVIVIKNIKYKGDNKLSDPNTFFMVITSLAIA